MKSTWDKLLLNAIPICLQILALLYSLVLILVRDQGESVWAVKLALHTGVAI